MPNGNVVALFISPTAGSPMEAVTQTEALAGLGLAGDRYANAIGSYNQGNSGGRQVTLMNALFFVNSGFHYAESRRNIITIGVELMWLIGREFQVGDAVLLGKKYCDPCNRPSTLSGNPASFQQAFFDRGGLIAEVLTGGLIRVSDEIILPKKNY